MLKKAAKKIYTSHDRIFKEFLERFLSDFMRIFFPKEAARLDFTTVNFLRQELIVNMPKQKLRITDVVAELKTRDGEPEVIIVHVEVEGNQPKPLPKRMFDYYALLRMLRQKQVLPLALVLTPGVGGLKWQIYKEELWNHELVRFRYGQVGVRDLQSEQYLAAGDPIAATFATLMKPGRAGKAAVKLQALQTVIASSLTEGNKLFLINVVETYLPREQVFDAKEEVMRALKDVEKTWMEKLLDEGEQKGKQKGQQEGMRTLLMLMLTSKFGPLPQPVINKLNTITDLAVFSEISQQLLTAPTLEAIVFPEEQAGSVRQG